MHDEVEFGDSSVADVPCCGECGRPLASGLAVPDAPEFPLDDDEEEDEDDEPDDEEDEDEDSDDDDDESDLPPAPEGLRFGNADIIQVSWTAGEDCGLTFVGTVANFRVIEPDVPKWLANLRAEHNKIRKAATGNAIALHKAGVQLTDAGPPTPPPDPGDAAFG